MSRDKPPPGALSIDQILAEARSHLTRLTIPQLISELGTNNDWGPTMLIDIRPTAQRIAYALEYSCPETIPNALIIERNVLEWRCDPQSDAMHPDIEEIVKKYGYETRMVVFCQEGYTSSLAARELQRLGLRHVTDLEGGYKAWCEEPFKRYSVV